MTDSRTCLVCVSSGPDQAFWPVVPPSWRGSPPDPNANAVEWPHDAIEPVFKKVGEITQEAGCVSLSISISLWALIRRSGSRNPAVGLGLDMGVRGIRPPEAPTMFFFFCLAGWRKEMS